MFVHICTKKKKKTGFQTVGAQLSKKPPTELLGKSLFEITHGHSHCGFCWACLCVEIGKLPDCNFGYFYAILANVMNPVAREEKINKKYPGF